MFIGLGLVLCGQGFSTPGESLGPELITNGGFDNATGWTLDGDPDSPVISGGKLHTIVQDSGSAHYDFGPAPAGTYRLTYTIDAISSGCSIDVLIDALAVSTSRTTAGTFAEDFVLAAEVAYIHMQISNSPDSNTVIDNVSFREVL